MKTTRKINFRFAAVAVATVFTAGSSLLAQPTGPPPLPPTGGAPPCWPPPCIPIDNGIIFLMIGAVLLGTTLLYKAGFKFEFKK